MLRYYSYYSVGGYKDMFLGNSAMEEKDTFFLPLLPVMKKKLIDKPDEELAAKIQYLESLPQIKILRNDRLYDFPVEANNVISHGGYKIIYYQPVAGRYVLSIRDIDGDSKDETGRTIPFLLAMVGDSESDKYILNKLFTYMATNIATTTTFFSKLFAYDAEKNGICFHLQDLNKWISDIDTGKINIESAVDILQDEAFVVIPGGLDIDICVKEQGLQNKKVIGIFLKDIISDITPKDLLSFVDKMRQNNHKKLISIIVGVIVCLILGIIVALL